MERARVLAAQAAEAARHNRGVTVESEQRLRHGWRRHETSYRPVTYRPSRMAGVSEGTCEEKTERAGAPWRRRTLGTPTVERSYYEQPPNPYRSQNERVIVPAARRTCQARAARYRSAIAQS